MKLKLKNIEIVHHYSSDLIVLLHLLLHLEHALLVLVSCSLSPMLVTPNHAADLKKYAERKVSTYLEIFLKLLLTVYSQNVNEKV